MRDDEPLIILSIVIGIVTTIFSLFGASLGLSHGGFIDAIEYAVLFVSLFLVPIALVYFLFCLVRR